VSESRSEARNVRTQPAFVFHGTRTQLTTNAAAAAAAAPAATALDAVTAAAPASAAEAVRHFSERRATARRCIFLAQQCYCVTIQPEPSAERTHDMPSQQHPIPSGFGAQASAHEVIGDLRLDDKLAIVTGGYSGIGVETTRVLVAAGAHVIVPARDFAKAESAVGALANVTIEPMDLSNPSTIAAFAARHVDTPLHLLVNNAGLMAAPLSRDARGLESQLATNHVGHFDLFCQLLPALRRAEGARVIALSSRGHVRSAFDFNDPNFLHRRYDKMVAYGQSKTANILFAVEADRRYAADGIRAYALHPGAILDTDLARHYDPAELELVIERARRIGSFKTVEQGAATTIFCATSPMLADIGGVYCENCDIAAIKSDGDDGVRPYAIDPEAAQRLWTWTERAIA